MEVLQPKYYSSEKSLEKKIFWRNNALEKKGTAEKNRLSSYRYGFNGMEKDDDVKGAGNSYNYGARFHDPRIGRWLSVDPFAKDYSSLSPYNYGANSPVMAIDPDGKRIYIKTGAEESMMAALSSVGLEGSFKINRRGRLKVNRQWYRLNKGNLSPQASEIYAGLKVASSRKIKDITVSVRNEAEWVLQRKYGYPIFHVNQLFHPHIGSQSPIKGLGRDEVVGWDYAFDDFVGISSQFIPGSKAYESSNSDVIINNPNGLTYLGEDGEQIESNKTATIFHLILDQGIAHSENKAPTTNYENLARELIGIDIRSGFDIGKEQDYWYRANGSEIYINGEEYKEQGNRTEDD